MSLTAEAKKFTEEAFSEWLENNDVYQEMCDSVQHVVRKHQDRFPTSLPDSGEVDGELEEIAKKFGLNVEGVDFGYVGELAIDRWHDTAWD